MNIKSSIKTTLITLVPALLSSLSGSALAAPGIISQTPLYLTNGVQPNIFFMIDDSGSMDWEDLLNKGTQYPGQSLVGYSGLDETPDNYYERRLVCRGFNVMAYDPTKTYTPWAGVDSAGNPYKDLTLTTARSDPYYTRTTNISNHTYFVWNDADGDGEYDGPGSTNYNGGPSASDECGDVSSNSNGVQVNTLSSSAQTNYANWWSYYRKREYVVKRAISQIVANSQSRMGLSSIHNNNSIGTQIEDMADSIKKSNLQYKLFRVNSSGGTPLRLGLDNAGTYFESGKGSPLFSSFQSSPILPNGSGGECQQNFTILMSDGYWNGSSPSVGNQDSNTSNPFDGGSYADSYSNTLADVAMKYYKRDLKTSYPDQVPTIPGVDENDAQHMVTFTVAFGVSGSVSSNPTDPNAAFSWPQPTSNANTTVDDMRHAAWNGRGQFLDAGDPQELIDSLNATVNDISNRSGTAAAVSFNSTSLQTDTLLYQSRFDANGWNGDLLALKIDQTTNPPTLVKSWFAAEIMDAGTYTRNLITFNPAGAGSSSTFTWNNLTVDQQADLCAIGRDWSALPSVSWLSGWPSGCYKSGGAIVGDTTKAKALLDYIWGDHGNEGTAPGQFRNRNNHRLGDIVHSGPLYVGAPNARYPNLIEGVGKEYSTFVQAKANRKGMVYVGSNDGMLHAFDSSENLTTPVNPGREVFAYIPNLVYSANKAKGLHYLAEQTNPNTYKHRYYVDLSASAADAYVNGGWKTILLGGMRGGGKGIFAMDVTDPTIPATSMPMWEFTNTNLGYTFSEISIGRMNNGKWAAIFGNGYNTDPGGDGKAKLFILYLDGSNLSTPIILDTKAGSISSSDCSNSSSDCNGMSSPAIADLNGDGNIDRIYAGDLQGNMWVFDVSASTSSSWKTAYGTPASPQPLFTACSTSTCDSGGRPVNRQPITSKPSLARHATQAGFNTLPNVMVFFGTGQYVAENDNYTSGTQTFFGVWDGGTGNLKRSNLVAQTIGTDTKTIGTTTLTLRKITSTTNVDYDKTNPDRGWRIDLPDGQERMVVTPHALGNIVFFNTMIPATNSCQGGSGWLMSVNQIDGKQPNIPVVDLNNDGIFNTLDLVNGVVPVGIQVDGIPTESRFIGDKRVTATSKGKVKFDTVQSLPPSPPSRMSWTDLSE